MNHCHSCGMPITNPAEARGNYCQYCSDEQGNLQPKEIVQKGIAQWLESFAPDKNKVDFNKRAEYYMKSMPAWN